MNAISTISIVAGAIIVIGGVAYAIYRRGNQDNSFPVKDVFEVSDILSWVDKIVPSIKVNGGSEYYVKVLPTKETQEILTKKTKDAYALLFVEKTEEGFKVLRQTVIVAKSLAPEIISLKNGTIVEMPIQI